MELKEACEMDISDRKNKEKVKPDSQSVENLLAVEVDAEKALTLDEAFANIENQLKELEKDKILFVNLAKGFCLEQSVKRAKDYISGALSAMLDLGRGSGPMNHAFDLQGKFGGGVNHG